MTKPAQPAARIVVGVDGSEPSRLGLRWAAHQARAMGGAQIEAVMAWHYPVNYGTASAYVPAGYDPRRDAERSLEQVVSEVFGEDRPVGLDLVVREGGAAKVLLERSRDVTMLIVGSRGHGGFAGLLLGSVSMTCAEHATCPVQVMHGTALPPSDQ
jgi:nucleotide-binding universal stress UspA family protein